MKHSDLSSHADSRASRDLDILTDNLEDIHSRICRILACNYIQTEALADLYAGASAPNGASRPSEENELWPHLTSDTIREHFTAEMPSSEDIVLPQHKTLLQEACRQLTTVEQMCLCRSLLADDSFDVTTLAARLLGRPDPIEAFAHGKIVYQHNIYTDEAFLHFSRALPTAKACYADSFTGVCEQVFDGQCEYCILPLENTQDGKLVRFYGLIEKYELKIALTCTVTTSDNRHSTVFGLCRRGITWPQLLVHDRSVCFEFLFWQESSEHLTLAKLLSAAECASLSLLRADCLPRSDDEIVMGAGYPFDLCFELSPQKAGGFSSERDFLAFLTFLSIHSPTHLPLGIYQHI